MIGLDNILTVWRQDQYDRQLYGASVVDAYLDLHNLYGFVARRLPHMPSGRLLRLVYIVLAIAEDGGFSHG